MRPYQHPSPPEPEGEASNVALEAERERAAAQDSALLGDARWRRAARRAPFWSWTNPWHYVIVTIALLVVSALRVDIAWSYALYPAAFAVIVAVARWRKSRAFERDAASVVAELDGQQPAAEAPRIRVEAESPADEEEGAQSERSDPTRTKTSR